MTVFSLKNAPDFRKRILPFISFSNLRVLQEIPSQLLGSSQSSLFLAFLVISGALLRSIGRANEVPGAMNVKKNPQRLQVKSKSNGNMFFLFGRFWNLPPRRKLTPRKHGVQPLQKPSQAVTFHPQETPHSHHHSCHSLHSSNSPQTAENQKPPRNLALLDLAIFEGFMVQANRYGLE